MPLFQNADETEAKGSEGSSVRHLSSLRQKAKILGRFKGFSKQQSETSEGGSELSDATSATNSSIAAKRAGWTTAQKSIDQHEQQTSPSNSQGPSPGASRKSSVIPGKSSVFTEY